MRTGSLITTSVGIAVIGFVGLSYISTNTSPPKKIEKVDVTPPPRLETNIRENPITFDRPVYNEDRDLDAAYAALDTNDLQQYQELRQRWKGIEKAYSEWFLLDAEALQRAGQRDATISLLNSDSLKGRYETERLTRLAALNVSDHPEISWDNLDEASAKDPKNTDIHIYKAGLLETADKGDLAIKEYQIALQKDANSSFLKEQLGEFYLRSGEYEQALKVFQDALTTSPTDAIYLKTVFLSRIVHPIKLKLNPALIPSGTLSPLATYINTLPPDSFWNEAAFAQLPEHVSYLANNQETFWLELLNALANQNEQKALQILDKNSFKTNSWAPELEANLKFILTFRQSAQRNPNNFTYPQYPVENAIATEKEYLDTINALSSLPEDKLITSISLDLYDILVSKIALTLPFLNVGWEKVAVQFNSLSVVPEKFPSWIAYKLTEAIADIDGNKTALAFATKQTSSPELSLVIGRIMIEDKRPQDAFNILSTIYKNKNEIGSQASLLIAPLFLTQNNPKAAKEAILSHQDLANNIQAREILARAFFQEGDAEVTYRIYQSLEPYSTEAKSFLAHQAFVDRNWKLAGILTEELLKIYPNSSVLKENLRVIVSEQMKALR